MRTSLYLILFLSIFTTAPLSAETVVIPGHMAIDSNQVMPKRGTSMERVLNEFGEPEQRIGPTGEPPISEWVYGNFRVYFEHQSVLHAIDLSTLIMPK